MKIELLMQSIDQEFTGPIFNNGKGSENWPYNVWRNDYWRNEYKSFPAKSKHPENMSLYLKLRKESFGGLIYNMLTKAIFKLDEPAYQVMSLLILGVKFSDLNKQVHVSDQDIETLKYFLLRFSLWNI